MRERVETFEQYVERTEVYFETIRAAGDLPWFEDAERSRTIAERLGLPVDTDPTELRRALWSRRSYQGAAV